MRNNLKSNKGRIGQNERDLVLMDKICKEFQKFYQDFSYEELLDVYDDSMADYISYIECASTPERSTIVDALWSFQKFQRFLHRYLVVNTMCGRLGILHRARKASSNYYSELQSEIREMRRHAQVESLTVMSESFEAWTRQDETYTLVEYEERQSTFIELKAWFNRLTEWLDSQKLTESEEEDD